MPQIIIRPGFLVSLTVTGLLGLLLHQVAHQAGLGPGSALSYVAWFTGLHLAVILVHELGHVLVAAVLGVRWSALHLDLSISVSLDSRTNGDQVAISLAGPAVHTAAAAALVLSGGIWPVDLASPVSVVGWVLLFEAVWNMLPLGSLDGRRALSASWACLRGGSKEFYPAR